MATNVKAAFNSISTRIGVLEAIEERMPTRDERDRARAVLEVHNLRARWSWQSVTDADLNAKTTSQLIELLDAARIDLAEERSMFASYLLLRLADGKKVDRSAAFRREAAARLWRVEAMVQGRLSMLNADVRNLRAALKAVR